MVVAVAVAAVVAVVVEEVVATREVIEQVGRTRRLRAPSVTERSTNFFFYFGVSHLQLVVGPMVVRVRV